MKSYLETLKKEDCNGCGACALKCPKKAITMQLDEEGFLYPVIDKEKCINCGICKKVCNAGKDYDMNVYKNSDAYISYTKNEEDKKNSSSGGMFFPLVRYVIEEKKGVVFGVEMTENFIAKHSYAETIEDAKKFQGSKYVKSDLNNSYIKAKEFLNNNRTVLFSGTPCQCAGLRNFLGKEYENLITCELICHANPSPKIFNMYLESIKRKYNKEIKMIYFRSKETGWKNQVPIIEFIDGTKILENSYFLAFASELINRPSCYECRFSSKNRYSDFTIGDFWGIEKYDETITSDDTGISLFCVNTEKGKEIFKNIKRHLFIKKADISKSFQYNHHKNIKSTPVRKRFFKKVENKKINDNNLLSKITIYSYINKIINKINKITSK